MATEGTEKETREPVAGGPVVETVKGPPPRHVFRWDLDKTYLDTDFDSLRGLWRSAFEKAEAKQAVPGAAALLRELKRLDGARVCFISGSPQQMRRVLTRKLQLDGVEFDEFVLKNNMRNLLKGRFRAVREQVGYKLPALLAGRAVCAPWTRETCFGDDAEADGFVYSLYADLLAGRVRRATLADVLLRARVYPDDADRTLTLAEGLARADAVGRIFIRLDRRSPTARFDRYGTRLVPIYNYFQAGLVLFEDGLLDAPALLRIVREMMEKSAYTPLALRNSLEDLLRRGRLGQASVTAFAEACERDEEVPDIAHLGRRTHELRVIAPSRTPPGPPAIDYLAAFDEDARPRDAKPTKER